MKYIDAEKLIAEIERRREICADIAADERNEEGAEYYRGKEVAHDEISSLIASLQQEQPNKYETALEKAREWMPNVNQGGHAILIDIFPELGEGLDPRYNGRKQEQPEVELEKEYKEWWETGVTGKVNIEHTMEWFMHETARHFYELGLNARKEK